MNYILTKIAIRMGIRNLNGYRTGDISNDHLLMLFKPINICNLESYKAFF